MAKVLIVYYSRGGNTQKMAEYVSEGVEAVGVECMVKKAEDATAEDLKEREGIILGSPTYYGHPAAEHHRVRLPFPAHSRRACRGWLG